MPKKATPARSGVQRTKPKTQKSFELVRSVTQVQEREIEETTATIEEPTSVKEMSETSSAVGVSSELAALPTVPQKKEKSSSVATEVAPELATLATVPQKKAKSANVATEVAPVETITPKAPATVETPITAVKGSASARMAARKNTQRTQRSQATLITAEHYSYVRRDLAFIAILAAIMFIAIIVLYFIPGIGV